MKKINMISIIVAIYKDTESLDLILESLYNQTYIGKYEVIVAEDGENLNVKKHIDSLNYNNLIHTTQKDEGWRKNKSLNNAIRNSKGDLFIFLDGDCIPYSNLIEKYALLAEEKSVLCGRRVELGPHFSKNIRNKEISSKDLEKTYFRNYFKLMRDNTRHYEEGIKLNNYFHNKKYKNKESHIIGCNFALNKEDIYAINGFDENYLWPSVGEDTDIEIRLARYGCKMKIARNKSNVYHLYHQLSYSQENNTLATEYFNKIEKQNLIKCKNGLEKI